jgi:1-acyl-sn-glycerol-3-phosphate acyltransferase
MFWPRPWPWLIRGFRRYVRRYLARNFHALRLSRTSSSLPTDRAPVLIVLNHPSWWDPLVGVFLSGLWPLYEHYAIIDARGLNRYRFFARLGFLGIELGTYRGAARFWRYGLAILSQPQRALWVTAQGRFADVRERPIRLEKGAGHLAAHLRQGWVVPIALEYTFWTERTPEILIRIGPALNVADLNPLTPQEWSVRIATALTQNMDTLASEAISRNAELFETLLTGRSGVGGWYERWQRLRAFFRGERYQPEHATILTAPSRDTMTP